MDPMNHQASADRIVDRRRRLITGPRSHPTGRESFDRPGDRRTIDSFGFLLAGHGNHSGITIDFASALDPVLRQALGGMPGTNPIPPTRPTGITMLANRELGPQSFERR